uniref:Amine oxidase domain-containing protein n=1 Tax=Chromera velia CCMP2878 TaxID=1169474 RepID=A0A0G4FQU4_9ALVE|eukprot:Cvel_18277.t1-p1 / transcript=Cvel_18277.t1 / gene=Cvel_18277 / organism=Chromera_velia_CCMP2878 / gene_product=hypothetical protein / transcript_product=hypothetical protein / location=Cvel_scaffold1506:1729-4331(-) / protein_length=621 / sequence_SO=supercontig / SO=protein_coding / is_pseudo=false
MRFLCLFVLFICSSEVLCLQSRWNRETGTTRAEVPPEYARSSAKLKGAEQTLPESCDLSLIGASWGSIYFGWRLAIDTQTVDPSRVCIFEANTRVGGRIFSVRDLPGLEDLVVDVGGYRFKEGDLLPAQLINDVLKLPTVCYYWKCDADGSQREEEGESEQMYKMVDVYGHNGGYATGIEVMIEQLLAKGAQLFFGTPLVGVYPSESSLNGTRLVFADPGTEGGEVSVESLKTLLGVSHNALMGLKSDSLIFSETQWSTLLQLKSVSQYMGIKVYTQYDDAWWYNTLGLMSGTFKSPSLTGPPVLSGRYHDGPTKCVIGRGPDGKPVYSREPVQYGNCSGALLVYYENVVRAPYYEKAMQDPGEPLVVIESTNNTKKTKRGEENGIGVMREEERAEETDDLQQMIAEIHDRLMAYHKEAFEAKGVDPSSVSPPRAVFMGLWTLTAPFTPGYGSYIFPAKPTQQAAALVRRPVKARDLFVCNQDYGYEPGWAQGSLLMAEKILEADLGVGKPVWLDEVYYQKNVVGIQLAEEAADGGQGETGEKEKKSREDSQSPSPFEAAQKPEMGGEMGSEVDVRVDVDRERGSEPSFATLLERGGEGRGEGVSPRGNFESSVEEESRWS